jgi:hypothetical protein
MDPAEYIWNYYSQYATTKHPFGKDELVAYANGSHFTTARDANGHLLLDFNHDGEIDVVDGGFAFHEHNGRGIGGTVRGNPFTNFWFDDNWLARYMSSAYSLQLPNGLSYYADFTRWQILAGDASHWSPYGSDYFDTLALDGMYALAVGDTAKAVAKWERMVVKSAAKWDKSSETFLYPNITENYHMALFRMLTEFVRGANAVVADPASLLQHSVALRSSILSLQQQQEDGSLTVPIGWLSGISDPTSLINTESSVCAVLALGVRALWTLEAGQPPLRAAPASEFAFRLPFVFAAQQGRSMPGLMTSGPNWPLAAGKYAAVWTMRAPSAMLPQIATLQVLDGTAVLASRDVRSADLASSLWVEVLVVFNSTVPIEALQLQTVWLGGCDLDLATVRVVTVVQVTGEDL